MNRRSAKRSGRGGRGRVEDISGQGDEEIKGQQGSGIMRMGLGDDLKFLRGQFNRPRDNEVAIKGHVEGELRIEAPNEVFGRRFKDAEVEFEIALGEVVGLSKERVGGQERGSEEVGQYRASLSN